MALAETLPPGPRTPSWLQALLWVYRPGWWLERCDRRYPDLFRISLPSNRQMVMVTRPELIAQLFAMGGEVAAAGKANALLRPMVGERSLLLLDGQEHARERKRMMPPFHGERMRAYAETIREIAQQSLASWPRGEPFKLHGALQEITLEVIFRVVMGMSRSEETSPLRTALRQLLEFTRNPALLLLMRADGAPRGATLQARLGRLAPDYHFKKLRARTDGLLYAELQRRRDAGEQRDDILSLLLSARDEQGQPMTDAELRDELMTLLVAGHETTATTLSWTLAELIRHPAAMARARAELESGPQSKLPYLEAVIPESLRLHPVVPIVSRRLEQPTQLGEYTLPAGAMVCPCIYLTHRRPDLYPDPEAFRPERFLNGTANPAAYFPFGGGARRCIGRAFALFEMKVILAQVLPQVALRFAPRYRLRMVRRSITLAPSGGVPVVAERR